jgi:hypothetical protein
MTDGNMSHVFQKSSKIQPVLKTENSQKKCSTKCHSLHHCCSVSTEYRPNYTTAHPDSCAVDEICQELIVMLIMLVDHNTNASTSLPNKTRKPAANSM